MKTNKKGDVILFPGKCKFITYDPNSEWSFEGEDVTYDVLMEIVADLSDFDDRVGYFLEGIRATNVPNVFYLSVGT